MKETSKKGKELKLKEYRLNMGLFDFDIIGVIGEYSKMSEYIAWKFEDKDFDTELSDMGYVPRGKCYHRRGYVPVIWLPREPKTKRERATFAHEAVHALFHLFEWSSTPISRDTEEVFCHALAHIVTNLFNEK